MNLRAVKTKRFCGACAIVLDCTEYSRSAGEYISAVGGKMKILAAWPPVIKTVARLSCVLNLVPPTDAVLALSLIDAASVVPGQEVPAGTFAWLFLAQAVKWPPALARLRQHQQNIRLSDTPNIAEAALGVWLDLIHFCDGCSWDTMFARMNVGRGHATTGLAVASTHLGLLRPGERAKRSKKDADNDSHEPWPGEVEVRLGKGQLPYMLVAPESRGPARAVLAHLFETDAALRLRWPRQGELVAFMSEALAWATRVRSFIVDGFGFRGAVGSSGSGSSYCTKSFTRLLVLKIQEAHPGIADNLRMSQVSEWLPDESEHCKFLDGKSVAEVRKTFGLNPLMMSCHACLAGTRPDDDHKAILKATDDELMVPVNDFYKQTNGQLSTVSLAEFAPGPHVIMDQVLERTRS